MLPTNSLQGVLLVGMTGIVGLSLARRLFWRVPMPEANYGSARSPGCMGTIAPLTLLIALTGAYVAAG